MNKDEKFEELEKAKEEVIIFWLEQINELKKDLQRAQSKIEKLENNFTNFTRVFKKR